MTLFEEILLNIDPEKYGYKAVFEQGKKVIHAVLKCALYEALIGYLLFWRDLARNMKLWGFQNNTYNTCVMNKVVDGNYCTVCWRVDDLRISHVESTVFYNILKCLEKQYGKVAPMTTTWGNIHDYLGIVLDLITKGKVIVMVTKNIQSILETAPT